LAPLRTGRPDSGVRDRRNVTDGLSARKAEFIWLRVVSVRMTDPSRIRASVRASRRQAFLVAANECIRPDGWH
jgi:hypothetical protein